MTINTTTFRDPYDMLAVSNETLPLAILSAIEGASYRPIGAGLVIMGVDEWCGSLSSGCIEADIARQSWLRRDEGKPFTIRYGKGSSYFDIKLPCGGGLDILVLPKPDLSILQKLSQERARRVPCSLQIDLSTGHMRILGPLPTGILGKHLTVCFEPEVRFLVFGKGPEPSMFASLVAGVGYHVHLFSPNDETLENAKKAGCAVSWMTQSEFPADAQVDHKTAIVLFFHDHDWEPPILKHALSSPAFYVGAQGSRRAAELRKAELSALGVSRDEVARLHGPIGLIPSTKDARTLAVSVLAEILAMSKAASDGLRDMEQKNASVG